MQKLKGISPCLWFDGEAEAAARFYVGIFPNSSITRISYYGEEGQDIHGHKPGTVLTVAFELAGNTFTALNGGPNFKFNEAISFQIECETQAEIDYYTEKLSADPKALVCGWLKDKFGVSWQAVPTILPQMLCDADRRKSERVMRALLAMKKLDIAALKAAYDG